MSGLKSQKVTVDVRELPPQPNPSEEKWAPVVAEKNEATTFYDPANRAHMSALSRESHINMLGETDERATWPVLVYKSNAAYGFGLVAKRDIKKNEAIAPYLGVKTCILEKVAAYQEVYAFHYSGDNYILAHKYGSVAAFANHSFSVPNMYHTIENGRIIYKAQYDIPEGSALLLDYGMDYSFPERTLYLSPYENGKSAALNLEHNKALYDARPLTLTPTLVRCLKITNDATHCIVPKAYYDPDLIQDNPQFAICKHLPIYLAIVTETKITVLSAQPHISILMLALLEKNIPIAKKLIQNGADIFAETMDHTSVLGIATELLTCTPKSEKPLNEVYLTILKKIHQFYKEACSKDTLKEKFESYILQHVKNDAALKIIGVEYPQFSFVKAPIQTATTASSTASNANTYKMLPVRGLWKKRSAPSSSHPSAQASPKATPMPPVAIAPLEENPFIKSPNCRKKAKTKTLTTEEASLLSKKRKILFSLCMHQNIKAIESLWQNDSNLFAHFSGSRIFSSNTTFQETSIRDWTENFRVALKSNYPSLIEIFWDAHTLLRDYFTGHAITVEGKSYQIDREECVQNFVLTLESSSFDYKQNMLQAFKYKSKVSALATNSMYSGKKERFSDSVDEAYLALP